MEAVNSELRARTSRGRLRTRDVKATVILVLALTIAASTIVLATPDTSAQSTDSVASMAGNATSQVVALRSKVNGRYVAAGSGGGSALIASRTAIGRWGQFKLTKINSTEVSLLAMANGKLVCAESAGAGPLINNRSAVGPWETFQLVRNRDGTNSFKARANNRFVTAENAGRASLIANRTAIGLWEKFDIIPIGSPPPTQSTTSSPVVHTTNPPPVGNSFKGWQLTKRNVGLAPYGLSCDSLPRYTGSMRPRSGSRISGVLINGNIDLREGDIVIERSCIRPSVGNTGSLVTNYVCGADDCPVISSKSIVIRDSEFDASRVAASQIAAACAFRGVGTLQRNYMHGMGSGICFYGTGMIHDAIADQNYVTDLRASGESHNEAATIRDFMRDQTASRVARFTNNRLAIESGNDTGGLFIQPTWDDIDDLIVEGNLIEGGGYNLFLNSAHGSYRNVRSINNRFRPTGWGPSAVQGGPGWSVWSGNALYDPTRPDAKGAPVQAS